MDDFFSSDRFHLYKKFETAIFNVICLFMVHGNIANLEIFIVNSIFTSENTRATNRQLIPLGYLCDEENLS